MEKPISCANQQKRFSLIVEFVSKLRKLFPSNKNHALKLYDRLLARTEMCHSNAIEKHISIFTEFIANNIEALKAEDVSGLSGRISYTADKVYVELPALMQTLQSHPTSATNLQAIWNYLLAIGSYQSPELRSIAIDKKNAPLVEDDGAASASASASAIIDLGPLNGLIPNDLLVDIMSKVTAKVDLSNPNPNPMDVLGQVFSKDVIGSVIQSVGMKVMTGEIDVTKFAALATSDEFMSKLPAELQPLMSTMGSSLGGGGLGGGGLGGGLGGLVGGLGGLVGGLGGGGLGGGSLCCQVGGGDCAGVDVVDVDDVGAKPSLEINDRP
jgi:hypothetical protein